MVYNKDQIKSFLPHREPFLFVDSIESITFSDKDRFDSEGNLPVLKDLLGGEVHARFRVGDDLDILRGHFPGNPILPGVVQIEVMAQSAAFMITPIFERPLETKINFILAAVQGSKFRKSILPGMDLDIYAVLKQARGNMMTYDARIEHNGGVCAQCTLMALMELLEEK